jgi:hypothetical protein
LPAARVEDKNYTSIASDVLVDMSERESEDWEKKGRRVTIDLDEVIVRSDGSKATMREFVKEMLYYNPDFYIERDDTWVLKRRRKKSP